jgi:hypothetical protein
MFSIFSSFGQKSGGYPAIPAAKAFAVVRHGSGSAALKRYFVPQSGVLRKAQKPNFIFRGGGG